jgi:hypothetical protein
VLVQEFSKSHQLKLGEGINGAGRRRLPVLKFDLEII